MTKANLSAQVKEYRFSRGWKQERMAQFLGISVRTIKRIEAGQTPSEMTVYKINQLLNPKEKGHAA